MQKVGWYRESQMPSSQVEEGIFYFKSDDWMSELLCLIDAYLREFSATVVAHADGGVVLDRTAFYPGGGGQPHDLGELVADSGIWQVTGMKKVDGQVVHLVQGALPAVGSFLVGKLDWTRRYQLMRTHTAMHLLCGVIWRDYGASVTGGNMDPLQGRMDFEFESLQKEFVATIEQAVNREVASEREVRVAVLPREEAFQIPDLIRTKINLLPTGISHVRTVEIVGLDLQADGGTHVANSREVGRIRIPEYKSKGKINKRFYVELS